MKRIVVSVIAWACLAPVHSGAAIAQVTFGGLLDEMADRDALTLHPQGAYGLYQSSSHDPASDVGPSTTNWAAWYANADYSKYHGSYNGEQILLSDTGPGAITRFWSTGTTTNGSIKVYIDGGAAPLSILNGYASTVIGNNSSFGSPLSRANPDSGFPAQNLYAPIPYQSNVLVTYNGTANHWYALEYRKYAAGTAVGSLASSTPGEGGAFLSAGDAMPAAGTVGPATAVPEPGAAALLAAGLLSASALRRRRSDHAR